MALISQYTPNPVYSELTLQSPEVIEGFVEIVGINRMVVQTNKMNGHLLELNVSTLPKGAYIIRLSDSNGTLSRQYIKL